MEDGEDTVRKGWGKFGTWTEDSFQFGGREGR